MSNDNLHYYYQHIYPFNALCRWLSYNDKLPLYHRELSFQYSNDIVHRYVKFKNAAEMKSRMTSQDDDIPRKVDAGAVWTGPPAKDNKDFKPMEREFIFDFDMNDYDDVRTCCEGKNTCWKCWKFMIIAKQVMTLSLSEDFGFSKFLYVFSGGRGLHIWICDEQARRMPDPLRKSIVDYLEIVTGNQKADSLLADNVLSMSKIYGKTDNRPKEAIKAEMYANLHPHVVRSLRIIKSYFFEVFNLQQPFTNQRCREVVLKILESKSKKLREEVIKKWSKCEQAVEVMWEALCTEVDNYERTVTDEQYPLSSFQAQRRKIQKITFIEQTIMLSFLYPRMDYNVSTMQNHLLKLPFSIHPKTQKVSVPMTSTKVDNFNPGECIDLNFLIDQVRTLGSENVLTNVNEQNAQKTRLGEFLSVMEQFCDSL